MQGFLEFAEEKKIIVKTDSGKQYKVDHQGNSLEEEIDDKDLPFTPDAKKTKPSTAGKYGSAYSTVRNLARKALEKQAKKTVKEEAEDLEEAQSKEYLQAVMRKHEKHAIDANKRGDDEAVIKHQNYINSVKKKLEKVVRNEQVEEGHVPDDHGRVLTPSDKDKLGKVAALMAKEKAAKEKQVKEDLQEGHYVLAHSRARGISAPVKGADGKVEHHDTEDAAKKRATELNARTTSPHVYYTYGGHMHESAPVAPSLGVHRIQVTVSDPDHTMVSQRKEKVQKFVRVTSNNKENALEQGKKHFAKKGWKVHDAEHVGMVHEETDLEEGKKGYAPGWMLKADPELAKKVKAHTQGYKDLKKYAGKDIPKKEVAEGYRGSSKADEPYWEAQEHKQAAEKAKKSGDQFSYHKFMSAHHDAMANWDTNKGRHNSADSHMSKAEKHEHSAQQARKESK